MSSKFNRRPTSRRRPPVCIAPPAVRLPYYDPRTPPKLTGYVHWLDFDPLGSQNAGGIITTGRRSPAGLYVGEMVFGLVVLGARIQDLWPANQANVTITYYDPLWGFIQYTFPTVVIRPTGPFDTYLLTSTVIPGSDIRLARFME